MAITKSAKKAIRVSGRKRVFNLRVKRNMKTAIKSLIDASRKEDIQEKKEKLRLAQKAIDKAQKKGIIKKNNAGRKKARMARIVKASDVSQ